VGSVFVDDRLLDIGCKSHRWDPLPQLLRGALPGMGGLSLSAAVRRQPSNVSRDPAPVGWVGQTGSRSREGLHPRTTDDERTNDDAAREPLRTR
jgi:hypothetical protein